MKTKICLLIGVAGLSTCFSAANGTNELQSILQRAWMEEEANRNLDAAIAGYQELATQSSGQRGYTATAIFRLGECYRKLGRTNEAKAQYARIVREFPEMTDLSRLSRQFAGLAVKSPPAFVLSFGDSDPDPTNNLRFPGGLAVDTAGNVYVSDTKNDRVQKFAARGAFITRWGGTGTNAGSFDYPQGLTVDSSGNVYVADTHNHRVQKFTRDGAFQLQWGTLGTEPGNFNSPYSIAVAPSGSIFVADTDSDRIQQFTTEGVFVSQFGAHGNGPGQFDQPKSITIDRAGNLYVADRSNYRVQKLGLDGTFITQWGGYGKDPGQFDKPHDVALDAAGNVFVADADGTRYNNRIQLFAPDGTFLTQWGTLGRAVGQFNFAARVALDPSGTWVYVCDAINNRIQAFAFSAP